MMIKKISTPIYNINEEGLFASRDYADGRLIPSIVISSKEDDYIKEIERAAELLSFSVYSSYRENSKNIVVCHNDLAEHNFLIKDDDMYLIDFDYCSIDLRIMDLTDLILKGIKNAAFDVDKAVNIIEAYNKICPLEKEEYKFIYILLSYPRDFYSIVRDYYHKQKDWDEEVFISRLNNKLMNEEFRHEFLVKYKELFF